MILSVHQIEHYIMYTCSLWKENNISIARKSIYQRKKV